MPIAPKPPAHDVAPQGSSDRAFGAVFAVFFLGVGLFPLVRGGDARTWALVVAAAFGVAALVHPPVLKLLNRGWQKFGALLHRVTSPVALALIYAVGIVPTGLLMRWLGQDPLRLAWQPDAPSYWIERRPPGRPDERMRRQF